MTPDWRDILQSTPMRLTLRLVALFLLISLMTFAATWWLANKALLDAAEGGLDAQLNELSASGDPQDIARAVSTLAARTDAELTILVYDGASGTISNIPETVPGRGLRAFDPHDRGRPIGRPLHRQKPRGSGRGADGRPIGRRLR